MPNCISKAHEIKQSNESFFIFLFYVCFYLNLSILSIVFVYKYFNWGAYTIGLGGIIMPFWYALGDAIAELFGYHIAKRLIWVTVIGCIFFATCAQILIHLPSPLTWDHQSSYDYIFGSIVRVSLGGGTSILVGASLNAYFITKWKVLLKGKYFWLRSLGSSFIGVVTQILLAVIFIYLGKVSLSQLFTLMLFSIAGHLVISFIVVWPNSIIVHFLKYRLALSYNQNIQINPYLVQ